jgi:hypothetical protein
MDGNLLFVVLTLSFSIFASRLFNKAQKMMSDEREGKAMDKEELPETWTQEPTEDAEVVTETTQPLSQTQPFWETKRPAKQRSPKKKKKQSPTPSACTPDATEDTTSAQPLSSPIRLKTKADARRAFLYSEIFNRKYE